MVIIEDRGLYFKSWKAYAQFLELEVRGLQQLLDSESVSPAFRGAKRKAKEKNISFTDLEGR